MYTDFWPETAMVSISDESRPQLCAIPSDCLSLRQRGGGLLPADDHGRHRECYRGG